jgi:hypothetical protein
MEKIRVKELINFRRASERSRITIANNLKSKKVLEDDISSGGDYWVSCLSAIANTFKYHNTELINEKINFLIEKIETTGDQKVKDRFQRNIDILHNFEDFDFQELKPNAEVKYITKSTDKSILDIKGLPIQAKPDLVFTFSNNINKEIGAIWFIAQLNGYDKSELAIFSDVLYRYLDKHFSKDYFVNPSYCMAVDAKKAQYIRYKDIEEGRVAKLLEQTIDDIIKLL